MNKLISNSNSLQSILGTLNSINIEAKHQFNLISQIKAGLQSNLTSGDNGTVNLQSKTITPTTGDQMITCDSEYDALSSVTINVDVNLKAENIISGATIFGVEGNVNVSTETDLKWWEEGEAPESQKTCNITFNHSTGRIYTFIETAMYKKISTDSSGKLFASFSCEVEETIDNNDTLIDVATNSLVIVEFSFIGNVFYISEDSQIIKIYENINYNDGYGIFMFYVSPNASTATITVESWEEF